MLPLSPLSPLEPTNECYRVENDGDKLCGEPRRSMGGTLGGLQVDQGLRHAVGSGSKIRRVNYWGISVTRVPKEARRVFPEVRVGGRAMTSRPCEALYYFFTYQLSNHKLQDHTCDSRVHEHGLSVARVGERDLPWQPTIEIEHWGRLGLLSPKQTHWSVTKRLSS